MVLSGLSTAWRLASWPTRRSPVLVNPTTDGVKRLPSLLVITVGFPPSITATTEFVVPRSIPTAFAIVKTSKNDLVQTKYPLWTGGNSTLAHTEIESRRCQETNGCRRFASESTHRDYAA